MTALLYRWPAGAQFGRVVPKNKFYERGQVTTAVKDKFVDEVQRITWAFKLAESTINLPGTKALPELQVFQVDAKSDDVSDGVLTAIDKAVKTPIIFERHCCIERSREGLAVNLAVRRRSTSAGRLLCDDLGGL